MFNRSIELFLAGEEQGCNIQFKKRFYFAMFALKETGRDACESVADINILSEFIHSSFKAFHKNKKHTKYITEINHLNKVYSFIVFFQEKFNTVILDEKKTYKTDKTMKILDFIKESGLTGRSLSEIILYDKSISKIDRDKILIDAISSGYLLENKIGESKKKIKMYFWKEFFNE